MLLKLILTKDFEVMETISAPFAASGEKKKNQLVLHQWGKQTTILKLIHKKKKKSKKRFELRCYDNN